jgi:hypothetical protein
MPSSRIRCVKNRICTYAKQTKHQIRTSGVGEREISLVSGGFRWYATSQKARLHQLNQVANCLPSTGEQLENTVQRRASDNSVVNLLLHLQSSNLLLLMKFETKNSGDVFLWRLLGLQVWVRHQKQVRECCPKVSSVNIYTRVKSTELDKPF